MKEVDQHFKSQGASALLNKPSGHLAVKRYSVSDSIFENPSERHLLYNRGRERPVVLGWSCCYGFHPQMLLRNIKDVVQGGFMIRLKQLCALFIVI